MRYARHIFCPSDASITRPVPVLPIMQPVRGRSLTRKTSFLLLSCK